MLLLDPHNSPVVVVTSTWVLYSILMLIKHLTFHLKENLSPQLLYFVSAYSDHRGTVRKSNIELPHFFLIYALTSSTIHYLPFFMLSTECVRAVSAFDIFLPFLLH